MTTFSNSDYQLDYLYSPKGSDELLSVRVFLKVMSEALEFTVESDHKIERDDLNSIFRGLTTKTFKRMNLKLYKDCIAFFVCCGKRYSVEFDKESSVITNLTEI